MSRKLSASKIANFSADDVLPILDVATPGFLWTLCSMWKVYSAVVVVLSTGPTEVKKLEQDFLKELSLYKKRIPESAACGLRSSGGFPHGKFSFGMRSLPDWAMVWDAIAELDGRFSTAFPYIATWEPIAMTKDTDHFVGLNGHKDNKLVADAPEIFANQSIILLSPPPKGFCRVGAFSSRVAVTSWMYRNRLESALARFSETETGMVGRAPTGRRTPGNVIGGQYISYTQVAKMSSEEILKIVHDKLSSCILDQVPPPPSTKQIQAAERELIGTVREYAGAPFRTEEMFRKECGNTDRMPRHLLMRAIAGGLSSAALYRCLPGGPVRTALAVYQASRDMNDRSLIVRWLKNAGQRRRTAAECASQPIPAPSKRFRKA